MESATRLLSLHSIFIDGAPVPAATGFSGAQQQGTTHGSNSRPAEHSAQSEREESGGLSTHVNLDQRQASLHLPDGQQLLGTHRMSHLTQLAVTPQSISVTADITYIGNPIVSTDWLPPDAALWPVTAASASDLTGTGREGRRATKGGLHPADPAAMGWSAILEQHVKAGNLPVSEKQAVELLSSHHRSHKLGERVANAPRFWPAASVITDSVVEEAETMSLWDALEVVGSVHCSGHLLQGTLLPQSSSTMPVPAAQQQCVPGAAPHDTTAAVHYASVGLPADASFHGSAGVAPVESEVIDVAAVEQALFLLQSEKEPSQHRFPDRLYRSAATANLPPDHHQHLSGSFDSIMWPQQGNPVEGMRISAESRPRQPWYEDPSCSHLPGHNDWYRQRLQQSIGVANVLPGSHTSSTSFAKQPPCSPAKPPCCTSCGGQGGDCRNSDSNSLHTCLLSSCTSPCTVAGLRQFGHVSQDGALDAAVAAFAGAVKGEGDSHPTNTVVMASSSAASKHAIPSMSSSDHGGLLLLASLAPSSGTTSITSSCLDSDTTVAGELDPASTSLRHFARLSGQQLLNLWSQVSDPFSRLLHRERPDPDSRVRTEISLVLLETALSWARLAVQLYHAKMDRAGNGAASFGIQKTGMGCGGQQRVAGVVTMPSALVGGEVNPEWMEQLLDKVPFPAADENAELSGVDALQELYDRYTLALKLQATLHRRILISDGAAAEERLHTIEVALDAGAAESRSGSPVPPSEGDPSSMVFKPSSDKRGKVRLSKLPVRPNALWPFADLLSSLGIPRHFHPDDQFRGYVLRALLPPALRESIKADFGDGAAVDVNKAPIAALPEYGGGLYVPAVPTTAAVAAPPRPRLLTAGPGGISFPSGTDPPSILGSAAGTGGQQAAVRTAAMASAKKWVNYPNPSRAVLSGSSRTAVTGDGGTRSRLQTSHAARPLHPLARRPPQLGVISLEEQSRPSLPPLLPLYNPFRHKYSLQLQSVGQCLFLKAPPAATTEAVSDTQLPKFRCPFPHLSDLERSSLLQAIAHAQRTGQLPPIGAALPPRPPTLPSTVPWKPRPQPAGRCTKIINSIDGMEWHVRESESHMGDRAIFDVIFSYGWNAVPTPQLYWQGLQQGLFLPPADMNLPPVQQSGVEAGDDTPLQRAAAAAQATADARCAAGRGDSSVWLGGAGTGSLLLSNIAPCVSNCASAGGDAVGLDEDGDEDIVVDAVEALFAACREQDAQEIIDAADAVSAHREKINSSWGAAGTGLHVSASPTAATMMETAGATAPASPPMQPPIARLDLRSAVPVLVGDAAADPSLVGGEQGGDGDATAPVSTLSDAAGPSEGASGSSSQGASVTHPGPHLLSLRDYAASGIRLRLKLVPLACPLCSEPVSDPKLLVCSTCGGALVRSKVHSGVTEPVSSAAAALHSASAAAGPTPAPQSLASTSSGGHCMLMEGYSWRRRDRQGLGKGGARLPSPTSSPAASDSDVADGDYSERHWSAFKAIRPIHRGVKKDSSARYRSRKSGLPSAAARALSLISVSSDSSDGDQDAACKLPAVDCALHRGSAPWRSDIVMSKYRYVMPGVCGGRKRSQWCSKVPQNPTQSAETLSEAEEDFELVCERAKKDPQRYIRVGHPDFVPMGKGSGGPPRALTAAAAAAAADGASDASSLTGSLPHSALSTPFVSPAPSRSESPSSPSPSSSHSSGSSPRSRLQPGGERGEVAASTTAMPLLPASERGEGPADAMEPHRQHGRFIEAGGDKRPSSTSLAAAAPGAKGDGEQRPMAAAEALFAGSSAAATAPLSHSSIQVRAVPVVAAVSHQLAPSSASKAAQVRTLHPSIGSADFRLKVSSRPTASLAPSSVALASSAQSGAAQAASSLPFRPFLSVSAPSDGIVATSAATGFPTMAAEAIASEGDASGGVDPYPYFSTAHALAEGERGAVTAIPIADIKEQRLTSPWRSDVLMSKYRHVSGHVTGTGVQRWHTKFSHYAPQRAQSLAEAEEDFERLCEMAQKDARLYIREGHPLHVPRDATMSAVTLSSSFSSSSSASLPPSSSVAAAVGVAHSSAKLVPRDTAAPAATSLQQLAARSTAAPITQALVAGGVRSSASSAGISSLSLLPPVPAMALAAVEGTIQAAVDAAGAAPTAAAAAAAAAPTAARARKRSELRKLVTWDQMKAATSGAGAYPLVTGEARGSTAADYAESGGDSSHNTAQGQGRKLRRLSSAAFPSPLSTGAGAAALSPLSKSSSSSSAASFREHRGQGFGAHRGAVAVQHGMTGPAQGSTLGGLVSPPLSGSNRGGISPVTAPVTSSRPSTVSTHPPVPVSGSASGSAGPLEPERLSLSAGAGVKRRRTGSVAGSGSELDDAETELDSDDSDYAPDGL